MNNRDDFLDVLKGFAMLMVILGHCIPTFPVNIEADRVSAFVKMFTYGFHTMLFLFCAGYASQLVEDKNGMEVVGREFLLKKFKRLLIPYLTFSFLSLMLRLLASSYTRSQTDFFHAVYGIIFEGKYYWFLYVLFIVQLLFQIVKNISDDKRVWVFVGFVLCIISETINTVFLRLDIWGISYIMLIAGSIVYYNKDIVNKYLKSWFVSIIFVILYVALLQIKFNESVVLSFLLRLLTHFVGISMAYSIMLNYRSLGKRCQEILTHFGKYSLQYYLVHMIILLPIYYFVAFFNVTYPILAVLMIFILAILISYVIIKLLLKIKIFNFLIGVK